MGHVMGARHDNDLTLTRNSPYVFDHGYANTEPTGGASFPWLTIMATDTKCSLNQVQGCKRILYWSNPNRSFGYYGSATGVAGDSDNHQTLNNTAQTVANFRCSALRRKS